MFRWVSFDRKASHSAREANGVEAGGGPGPGKATSQAGAATRPRAWTISTSLARPSHREIRPRCFESIANPCRASGRSAGVESRSAHSR